MDNIQFHFKVNIFSKIVYLQLKLPLYLDVICHENSKPSRQSLCLIILLIYAGDVVSQFNSNDCFSFILSFSEYDCDMPYLAKLASLL